MLEKELGKIDKMKAPVNFFHSLAVTSGVLCQFAKFQDVLAKYFSTLTS